MKRTLASLTLRFGQDVVFARQRARDISELLGFDHSEQIRLATATSEIARNAFRYARSGTVEFLVETEPQATLFIKVGDSGSGIPNLNEILEGRYQSSTGLGKGITGTQRLMDSFEIRTGAEGTTVEMSKLVPKYAPQLTASRIEEIIRKLSQRKPDNPYEEVERQNQELMKTLAELRVRQDELILLNRELEDTNRGVVALYAELDDRADALRRMSDAKTSFLSNMSHEFRTPLNSILSLSQMLLQRMDGDLTPDQEKQIFYIRASAQGLQEMVNDLLDIAKVEAGKVDVKAREFEVEDLFGALRGMLKPILETASVSLVFEELPELPTMFTDEGKISQILRNFISNALKFTERGEVRVSARLEDPQTIAFSVADTGIGIAPENLERVFEEFAQVENKLQRRVQGTGLGLPLSRQLAKLLGGRVELQSELGVGSTFSVHLPIIFAGTDIKEESEIPQLESGRIPVVLIEDNRETAFVISKFLEHTEFQVIPTYDTGRGMEVLDRVKPAAAILDVLVDGEASWETLKRIRTQNIPVITVSVLTGERDKALALGATAFLPKPLSRESLLKTLRSATYRGTIRKLLLIDDHELARYSLRELLGSSKLEILEARSGREGLELAGAEHPDVIFLDLMMPDITGFEVLKELRSADATRGIPVIVHSSQELSDQDLENLRLQSVALLPKGDTAGSGALDRISQALASVGFDLETGERQHA
ncbi:MAG: response regulator [Acidobacteria bacterium]|nr:response regulator [Acidobacteriota bacterium]